MAIQESDIMDFGNGIIGDDTFDVWRKKTNGIRQEIEVVEGTLTTKINTDISALSEIYIPQAGLATSVSTPLQFTSATSFDQMVTLGGSELSGSFSKLSVNTEVESATQLTSDKVKAGSKLILGTKTYTVPSPPAINNAVLTSATTNGDLAWQNAVTLFEQSGGLEQTTTVFEEVMPVGSIIALAGLTNDTNYLLCEGAFVSKDGEYSDLFDVIGYRYGGSANGTDANGNPFTHFQLPDYRGRVAVGTDSAGGFNAGSLGDYGGASNISLTSLGHKLTGDQSGVAVHTHDVQAFKRANFDNTGAFGTNPVLYSQDSQSGANSISLGNHPTKPTHNGADGTEVPGNVLNAGYADAISEHSHNITLTPANRVQPYIAIKYYIKAKQNTKIDFKIDIASSGLVSTDSSGAGQTVISPVNETVHLDVDPDNTSITLDSNSKVAIKTSPTIPGTITTSGPEFILNNSTRAGSNSHAGRAIVHGDGAGEGDPVLNGFDRKTVTTINDAGLDQNNDTLIINYNDISPNSFGDYTNGVIINGMKAIMFEDGSILQTGSRKRGNFKQPTETESGKHHTVAPQYSDAFCYVDDDDDVVIGGNSNGVRRTGPNNSNQHSYRHKSMLPDDEKVDKLYISYYNTHVIAKSGKTYSTGYGYSAASISSAQVRHRNSYFHVWERSFCESNNCKMSKIVQSGDISCHVVFALDDLGYFWGHGTNNVGCLANGTRTYSQDEPADPIAIVAKREELANSETAVTIDNGGPERPYNLASNRRYLAHIMNPMLDDNGAITTTPENAVSLLKVTDATAIGSYNGGDHYDTVAILGEDKRVYVAGYCGKGQGADGLSTGRQTHWSTVSTATGVPLENITKLYSGGEDHYTYFVAIDENFDVWVWGDAGGRRFANLTTNRNTDLVFATRLWDSTARNRRANYVITNNVGSGTSDANHGMVLIIASHQDSTGVEIDKEFYTHVGTTTGTPLQQYTHTVFNTSAYSIQDLYFSNGNQYNFYYVLARNKSTGKLELWSSGRNDNGNLGYQDGANNTHWSNQSVNMDTTAYRVNFSSDLLEKVVTIHCCRQYNTGLNTFVHLSDGRIFAVGYLRWSFDHAYSTQYSYKFSPIPMDV